jgi:hypothetical protein
MDVIERLLAADGRDVLRAIAAQDVTRLGVAAGTRMVVAPRGIWWFGVIDDPAGLAGIAHRAGDRPCWFTWRGNAIEEVGANHAVLAIRTRAARWIDDVNRFVREIRREVDRGPWLRFTRGPAPFDDTSIGTTLAVGRDVSNNLCLLDRLVSKRHCVFEIGEGYTWQLRDGGSVGGSYVNGHRAGVATLRDRDRVRIGQTEIEVMFDHRPRPRAPDAWRDDDSWRALFLDSQMFPATGPRGDATSAAVDADFTRLAGLRTGVVEWQRDAFRAVDARWLFATRDEAEVFFDRLLERDTAGFEHALAPLVGDACVHLGRGDDHAVMVRAGRVVAQLRTHGEIHRWTFDEVAARMLTRIAALNLG